MNFTLTVKKYPLGTLIQIQIKKTKRGTKEIRSIQTRKKELKLLLFADYMSKFT